MLMYKQNEWQQWYKKWKGEFRISLFSKTFTQPIKYYRVFENGLGLVVMYMASSKATTKKKWN